MKAWVCNAFQEPWDLTIQDIAIPAPGPGQVQIKVAAAGLNYGETLVFAGTYQKTPPLPYIPVSELSGVVSACGEGVSAFKVGDPVSAFSVALAGGGLAEYAVMPEAFVFPKPAGLSFVEAAAYPMNYWTAFNALFSRGRLEAGETLVVHGATGGIGVAGIAIGKAMGARVIATGTNMERLEPLRLLGADALIDLTHDDLRTRLLELTGGQGADVFLDPVGGDVFDASMRAIAPGGRILVVGFTSGRPAQARTNVMLVKMISIIGVEARLAIETTDGRGLDDFRTMLDWVAQGRIRPHVGRTYPFESAREGYGDILTRSHVGKSVLIVDPELCQ